MVSALNGPLEHPPHPRTLGPNLLFTLNFSTGTVRSSSPDVGDPWHPEEG